MNHGGGGIMVWACLSSHGNGAVHIIDGEMDSAMYRQILDTSHGTGAVHIIDGEMDGAMHRQVLEKSHSECEALIQISQEDVPT